MPSFSKVLLGALLVIALILVLASTSANAKGNVEYLRSHRASSLRSTGVKSTKKVAAGKTPVRASTAGTTPTKGPAKASAKGKSGGSDLSAEVAAIVAKFKAAPKKARAAESCAVVPRKKPASSAKAAPAGAGAKKTSRLFRRNCSTFIGFHGTQSINADIYETSGVSLQPLTSGADAELCDGLYITDNQEMAVAFSNNAAVNVNRIRPGSNATPKVCKIFVTTEVWSAIAKVFVPQTMLRAAGRAYREQLFAEIRNSPIAFSNLDLTKEYSAANGVRQMCVPPVHQRFLQVVCSDSTSIPPGHTTNYYTQGAEWNVVNTPA
ncbi:hypothetical protein BC829DRAFT_99769 [Chytridium lagenaria]|nr:hypothetical protein BC829DRAFT_99769 [Chytridium lagenaria]